MGMIINAVRGIHVLVRNMTIAAGFYNSLLECDEPALVIECLNGYRLKEKNANYGEFKTPIELSILLKVERYHFSFIRVYFKISRASRKSYLKLELIVK
jgi:hypothetical protein